jgi:hypothetical protein
MKLLVDMGGGKKNEKIPDPLFLLLEVRIKGMLGNSVEHPFPGIGIDDGFSLEYPGNGRGG